MTVLIPQISNEAAEPLLAELAQSSLADAAPSDEFFYSQSIIQPTGGLPIRDALFKQLRESILTVARSNGFPSKRPNSFLHFELEVAKLLAKWKPLWISDGVPSGEALRNDCWTFITIVVLPDIALWRWPSKCIVGASEERSWKVRIVGGSRNTFQRIFRRVLCLDRGLDHPDRWGLIRDLQEDDFSAILERPTLSSNRDVAVSLAEEYIAMKQRLSDRSAKLQTEVYRQATKAIRAYGVVQPLDLMSNDYRKLFIRTSFQRYERDLDSSLSSKLLSQKTKKKGFLADPSPKSRPARKNFFKRIFESD